MHACSCPSESSWSKAKGKRVNLPSYARELILQTSLISAPFLTQHIELIYTADGAACVHTRSIPSIRADALSRERASASCRMVHSLGYSTIDEGIELELKSPSDTWRVWGENLIIFCINTGPTAARYSTLFIFTEGILVNHTKNSIMDQC